MFTQDLFSVLSAGGPPGRLQVQVRVHHVPCDTTELCTRRFGAETSKPDVGQPRLKALLRLPQVPFFCKNAPFFAKKALQRYFKGPCGEKRGVQTPLFCPSGGPLAGSFWRPPPSKGPAKGPFFYPQRARFKNPMPPSKAHFLPLRGPFPGCLEAEKARQTPIERPSKAHRRPVKGPSNAHLRPI